MRIRTGRRTGGVTRQRRWVVLGAAVVLVAGQAIAQALDTEDTPGPVVGNATWFSGLGSPYGGCGLPQDALDSQDFVALNVFNTPGDYNGYSRPLTGADVDKMGMWDNGHNCGRWVKVTIDDYCTGTNDGSAGQPFCRNGSWTADKYNGATLTMLVADSCGDSNAWCRDDPYHLDLARDSLNRFQLNGASVDDMDPGHWNNRHVSWQFVSAPDYSGDIKIGFLQGAQRYWGAVSLSHLANGLHGVQYYSAGAWHDATMNGDMGQSYVLKPIVEAGTDFRIRAKDASDAWINNGREYSFSLPASCSGQCSNAYTPVSYTTNDSDGTQPTTTAPVDQPTTSTAPVDQPTTSTAPVDQPTTTTAPVDQPTTSTAPVDQPTTTTAPVDQPTTTATCSVETEIVSWPGGMLSQITIRNTGPNAVQGWALEFDLPEGQSVSNAWNAQIAPASGRVTATNLHYNGIIAQGSAVGIGFVANRTGSAAAPASYSLNGVACATS